MAIFPVVLDFGMAAGYSAGTQVAIGLDCASSEFFREGRYSPSNLYAFLSTLPV